MGKVAVKNREAKSMPDYIKDILVALFGGYLFTFLGIILLAFLLLSFGISENMVDIGILIIYILSCLLLGVILGKRIGIRRFLWGMLGGGIYFIMLILVSLTAHHSLAGEVRDIFTTLLLCVGSGALGGMLS